MHPLLSIKSITTTDIPKYSDFNGMYMYSREVSLYVANHALKQRSFSIKETTVMFLSHLDDPRYKLAVKECEAAILHSSTITTIYTVLAIVETIDQPRPAA